MNRDQLIGLLGQDERAAVSVKVAIAWLAAPVLLVLAFEVGGRLVTPSPPLRLPWQHEQQPYPPMVDYRGPAVGDLLQLAQLPLYDRLFADQRTHPSVTLTDESGYFNAPSGVPAPLRQQPRDITLIGASFLVAGSEFDRTFGRQLAAASGLSVYNAAWPGRGGLQSVLHLLDERLIGANQERFLVLTIVERSLDAVGSGFSHLAARLDEDGTYHPPTAQSRLRTLAREWLRWNQRLDDYLLKTSPTRALIVAHASWLPPMSLDMGLSSAVKLADLPAPWSRPVLFMKSAMQAVSRDYDEAGGPYIGRTLRRLQSHCDARGVRFVLVLIPDKYQLFHDVVQPRNYVRSGREGRDAESLISTFGRKLSAQGLDVVDLYPVLRRAQFEQPGAPLMYMPTDSHWSDDGIERCARYLADHLAR